MRKLIAAILLVGALAYAASASAVKLNFPHFGSTAGLKLNGAAEDPGAKQGHPLRLVPAETSQIGSAFTKRKLIDARKSFKTQFRFSLHDSTTTAGDGFAFVLHKGSKTRLGDGGGGLGYGSIQNSIAVEFDTFLNAGEGDDPDDNHISVHRNGNAGSSDATLSPDLEIYGGTRFVWISYSAKSEKLKVLFDDDATKSGAARLTYKHKISQELGKKVRAGFTAATGGANADMDILSWKLKQKKPRR